MCNGRPYTTPDREIAYILHWKLEQGWAKGEGGVFSFILGIIGLGLFASKRMAEMTSQKKKTKEFE